MASFIKFDADDGGGGTAPMALNADKIIIIKPSTSTSSQITYESPTGTKDIIDAHESLDDLLIKLAGS